jgi:hypothetical protein
MRSIARGWIVFAIAVCASCTQTKAQDLSLPELANLTIGGQHDDQDRIAVREKVDVAIRAGDFAALNRMERDYRVNRTRHASGAWLLRDFYIALAAMPGPDKPFGCRSGAMDFADYWLAADPQAPGSAIFKASELLAVGWCHRGGGYGNEVSDSDLAQFRSYADQAYAVLDAHRPAASDPEYYVTMMRIYLAQNRSSREVEALLDEAAAKEPYYYDLYYAAAHYWSPRWHGDADDFDWVARYAMEHTSAEDGRSGYARVYLDTALCGCRDNVAPPERELMKAGLRDLIVKRPVSRNVNRAIEEACFVGDYAESRALFALLPANDSAMGWASKADQAMCRAATERWTSSAK